MATKKLTEVLEKINKGEDFDINEFLVSKDMLEIQTILDVIFLKISISNGKQLDEVQYEIEKQKAIYFFGLLQCTSFEINEEDINIINYSLELENMILEKSKEAKKIKEMVENIIRKNDFKIVGELSKQFEKFPTLEETERLEKELDKIFSKREGKDLQTIENILAYNDPNMKLIKDILSTASIQEAKEVKKNGDNITKG